MTCCWTADVVVVVVEDSCCDDDSVVAVDDSCRFVLEDYFWVVADDTVALVDYTVVVAFHNGVDVVVVDDAVVDDAVV